MPLPPALPKGVRPERGDAAAPAGGAGPPDALLAGGTLGALCAAGLSALAIVTTGCGESLRPELLPFAFFVRSIARAQVAPSQERITLVHPSARRYGALAARAEGRARGISAYFGDGSQPEVLRSAGVGRASVVVITLDDTVSASRATAA